MVKFLLFVTESPMLLKVDQLEIMELQVQVMLFDYL